MSNNKQEHSLYKAYSSFIDASIKYLGAPKEELRDPWVGKLCTFNGILHFIVSIGLYLDKQKYIIKSSGEKKVAVLAVMNNKYRGPLYIALALHIISGTISHLGSALSIFLEENTQYSILANNLAITSSAAELLLHAPTALYLTPFVYGDKGVAPFVYGLVSTLLALSGASALKEALQHKKDQVETQKSTTKDSVALKKVQWTVRNKCNNQFSNSWPWAFQQGIVFEGLANDTFCWRLHKRGCTISQEMEQPSIIGCSVADGIRSHMHRYNIGMWALYDSRGRPIINGCGNSSTTPSVYSSTFKPIIAPVKKDEKKPTLYRSEIRRLNTTITIFLYVRLYPILRGVTGILEPQKYALAILVAGTSYLPIGWTRKLFPASFFGLTLYNWRTVLSTLTLLARHGVDGTARKQAKLLRL